jgi:hypothetical protein
MIKKALTITSVVVLLHALVGLGQETSKVELPMKENFHLFLLAGQSNMAGRGDVEAQDKQLHARVLMLTKDGTWVPAVDPMHYDKPSAGVGPGRTFGMAMADRDTNVTIGLIPVACGGSPISTWEPGAYFDQTTSHPYDDAIKRAKIAMEQGTLKGILWHQGESDGDPRLAPIYKAKLEELIARFRKDLDAPDLPFIVGQLGQFEKAPWSQATKMVNDAHIAVAKELKNVEFVSSDGLLSKSDNLHFDAPSQREFGKRYAEAYLKTQKPH